MDLWGWVGGGGGFVWFLMTFGDFFFFYLVVFSLKTSNLFRQKRMHWVKDKDKV